MTTFHVFESDSPLEITKSVLAMEATERDKIRSAIFSGMSLGMRDLRPHQDTIREIEFIINDMTEDELGDFNEWADVKRVQKIREAIEELRKETPA